MRQSDWPAGRIRTLRDRLGLSREALGERIGVRGATVFRWERGTNVPLRASQKRLDDLAKRAS